MLDAISKTNLVTIVDDDESVRKSLGSLLKSLGHTVELFSSGESFLNSETVVKTDCLILDVRMPGMNGLELQRRLAASHMSIPVIFITAHGDEEARVRALNGGAVEYLLKPFSEEALLKAIDTALKSK